MKIEESVIFEEALQEVVEALSRSGLLDLIIENKQITLSPTDHISDEEKTHVEPDSDLEHQESYDFEEISEAISSIAMELGDEERRVLILC